jgi:hypothetical protein
VDFFAQKIRRLRLGSNPRSWSPEASMLTTRPPKPLKCMGMSSINIDAVQITADNQIIQQYIMQSI